MRPSANFARDLLKSPMCVEVGVCEGGNAEDMLFNWKDLRHLHLVDIVRDGLTPINIGINKLRYFGERVTWHLCSSQEASKKFVDNSLDYVYIDAGHSHSEVISDISLWLPKVKIGGILSGHDVGTSGIDTAIAEYFKGKCTIGYPDWWIVKESDGK